MRMKYKCKKCGMIYKPGQFDASCPKCGNSDVEVIYEYVYAQPEPAPEQK